MKMDAEAVQVALGNACEDTPVFVNGVQLEHKYFYFTEDRVEITVPEKAG